MPIEEDVHQTVAADYIWSPTYSRRELAAASECLISDSIKDLLLIERIEQIESVFILHVDDT